MSCSDSRFHIARNVRQPKARDASLRQQAITFPPVWAASRPHQRTCNSKCVVC